MNIEPGIRKADLKAELLTLYEDYAAALDRNEMDRWMGFFTEDTFYNVISRESYDAGLPHATIYCDGLGMLRDRIALLKEGSYFEPRTLRHFISGLRIHSATEKAIQATANFLVIESLFDAEPQILMVGEYVDELVPADGGYKFRKRCAVYDQYRIRTTLVVPV
ncbi:MAG: aromatic-ring-hydroxylating dioxygenase subunit beta [Flavobacteriaceae bacterium]